MLSTTSQEDARWRSNQTEPCLPLSPSPALLVPYTAVLGVAAVVGILGNMLVIGTLACVMRTRSVGNIFIVNLAVSDLIAAAIVNPLAIVGVVWPGLLPALPALCAVGGSLRAVCSVTSLLTIGCISINRYVYICAHAHYQQLFTRRHCYVMCLVTWVAAAAIDLSSYAGWSRHGYDPKLLQCLWERNGSYSYSVFFVCCGVVLPLVVITTFYCRIGIHMSTAKRQVNRSHSPKISNHNLLIKTLRQARMMFIIFLTFAICWIPYSVILLVDYNDDIPQEAYLYVSLLAQLHASVNFILYGVCNKKIRRSYKRFFTDALFRELRCLQSKKARDKQLIRAMSSATATQSDVVVTHTYACCLWLPWHRRRHTPESVALNKPQIIISPDEGGDAQETCRLSPLGDAGMLSISDCSAAVSTSNMSWV